MVFFFGCCCCCSWYGGVCLRFAARGTWTSVTTIVGEEQELIFHFCFIEICSLIPTLLSHLHTDHPFTLHALSSNQSVYSLSPAPELYPYHATVTHYLPHGCCSSLAGCLVAPSAPFHTWEQSPSITGSMRRVKSGMDRITMMMMVTIKCVVDERGHSQVNRNVLWNVEWGIRLIHD